MKKTIITKENGLCSLIYTTSYEAQLLMLFLTDSYNGKYTREWIKDKETEGLMKNQIVILKRGNNLVLFDQYEEDIYDKATFDESSLQHTFTITRDVFLKVLDEWETTIAQKKEFIVIEVSPENDISIYGLDQLTEEDQQLHTLFWADKNMD